jgi:hypothetical protein
MKEVILIGALIACCAVLLSAVIILGWMHMQKNEQTPQETKVVIVKDTVANERDGLPIYPKRDPEYPLRGVSSEFQQIGTLTNNDDDPPMILPLFGRPIPARKDRWEYYTATDKYNMLRIPVTFENRDCMEEVGCREVYNKDTVFIPSYKKEFVVQLYKYRP